jgi:hypothetical protein
VNPRGIEEDELTFFHIFDAENSVPRGLRLFSDNGDFIAEETIEKGRLPNIWPSQDGDKTRFERCHLPVKKVMSSEFKSYEMLQTSNSSPRTFFL